MRQKKSFGQRAEEFLGGKGFYIVLFVCVAVIGVSAWLLLFSQYSPLAPGDPGDYLDAMGDIDNSDISGDPAGPSEIPDDQPEHQVPPPDTGKLTQEPNTPSKPTGTPPAEDTANDGGKKDGGDSAETMKPEDLSFIWPLGGTVTVAYSPDALIYSNTMGDWRVHDGIDLTAKLGTKVLSAAAGTVTRVESTDDMGTTVEIDHGAGVTSTYANLAGKPTVNVGDRVAMGAVIGSVGATALYETGDESHLHFSMALNGQSVDPGKYLPKR